jgi:broad specificity phosphatase PhoE
MAFRAAGCRVAGARRPDFPLESAGLQVPVAAELEELREVNVGDLDGRNDDQAWQACEATLVSWRSGDLGQRFPGGESGDELAARIGCALRVIARWAGPGSAIDVALAAADRNQAAD